MGTSYGFAVIHPSDAHLTRQIGKHNATPNELLELCLSLLLRDNLETQLGGLFP
jgi:hypothetical protein